MSHSYSLSRVAVTGVGLVDPWGGEAKDFFERMMQGESAIRLFHHAHFSDHLVQPAMHCEAFAPESAIGRPLTNLTDRYSQLGLAAAFSAWRDAGLKREDQGSDDYGVSWGTAVGGSSTSEKGYTHFFEQGKRLMSPLTVALVMNNAAASNIAIALGLGGACLTYSIACASSAVAIGEAFRRIRMGEAQVVLAGGSEAPLTLSVMLAWEAMRVVAKGDTATAHRACRPFHEDRGGLVLGEGAAALVLENWDHARARGASIYCELAGYGQSCDRTHLVRPDVSGQARAIQAAMKQAGLAPADVGYVNAHGTATREGDPIEIAALRHVFGTTAEQLAVSSTKSMHGHLLGAAGAMEAVLTVLALAQQAIPPTAHLDHVSQDCQGVRHVLGKGLREASFESALSHSFAFGGSNAVLAFRRTD